MEILASVLSEITEHCILAYPFEACGFVLGSLDAGGIFRGLKAYRAINAKEPEKQRRHFQIEPEEFLAAENKADEEGLDLMAIYHSHPDHPSKPSANDLEKAWPFYRYLITSVEKGQSLETRCWVLTPDRTEFLEESLIIT